jgi:hypothetical protein
VRLDQIDRMRRISPCSRARGIAYPTAARAVDTLVGLGVLDELTGRRHGRVFAYDWYLLILREG